ncbi:MAG: hypothetical protein [Bacteriophage sp.]|nr:MAG: hypothetical protein [Bacteriophage sp.]
MAINLPRYADDDAVDLVNGAYSQAMGEIEKNLTKASTDSTAAKTKAEQAYTSAEQAKTSVLEQKGAIDKLRGDVDGLIAGGGESTVPIATTSKAGIVKPDGSTISVQVDGAVSLADNSVNSVKLAAGGVTEDKLSDGVKAKLNKPAVEPYTLPVASPQTIGGVKAGANICVDQESGLVFISKKAISEEKLSDDVAAKLNKTYSLPIATATSLGGVKLGTLLSATEDGAISLNNNSVTETKLSADVQAKLNKETGLTEVPDNSVTSAKIVNGAVTEAKLSTDVQAKLNKTAPAYSLPVATTTTLGGVKSGGDISVGSTGTMTVGSAAVTTAKISNAAVTETKLSADVQAKLNKPAGEPYTLPVATKTVLGGVKLGQQFSSTADGAIALNDESIYTSSYVDNSVTEAKLSADVQAKLNRSAPAYSLPVASTSRLGGVKAGRDIDIDSSGLMTIGSGMIEESQLSTSVQNKLNKSGETISAELININTTSYAGPNCHGFKFGDVIIINIQARNLSGSSGIKIGSVIYAYTPRREMSGPCLCGNGLGQFVIRTNGDIIINPKGNGADGFFTCTYVR